jgi:hypothetical protein
LNANYSPLTLAATFTGWIPAASNMTLIANNLWQFDVDLDNETAVRFKFAANGSWTTNWGETNQTQLTAPITGTAVLAGNTNIAVAGIPDGIYRFTFNDATRAYSLTVMSEDAELDGMPNSWGTSHGVNTNDPGDASADLDGDGATNLSEYHAGTNPTDADDLVIQFAATHGKNYRLQYTDLIESGT